MYFYLDVTRSDEGVANPMSSFTRPTSHRISTLLQRSLVYSYVSSAYNNSLPLFLTRIRKDIISELVALAGSPVKTTSNDSLVCVADAGYDEIKPKVLDLCRYLMGVEKKLVVGLEEVYSKLEEQGCHYLVAWCNFRIAYDYPKLANKPFNYETLKIPQVVRDGLGITVGTYDSLRGSYSYSPELTINRNLPIHAQFLQCFDIADSSCDTYFKLLANTCLETDEAMLTAGDKSNSLIMLTRIFKHKDVVELVRCPRHENKDPDANKALVFGLTVTLVDKYGISIGTLTRWAIKQYLNYVEDVDKSKYKYIYDILNGETKVANGVGYSVEGLSAFRADPALHVHSLDVDSVLFTAYVGTDIAAKDDEGDEPAKKADEPNEDSPEEPSEEEPTEPEEPSEDPDDDPEDAPEETPPEPEDVVVTNDKVGITLRVDNNDTLDAYLYRREVGFLIGKILANPPKDMTAEHVAVLRTLKAAWLNILTVDAIDEILSTITNLPIKVERVPVETTQETADEN